MLLFKLSKTLRFYLLYVVLLSIFTGCIFTNKNDNQSLKNDEQIIEEQKKAQFLVKITEINIEIIKLIEIGKNQSMSEDAKIIFSEIEKSTYLIQKEINYISEQKLVTIPIFTVKTNSTVKLYELELIDKLMNQLINEVLLLEKIKNNDNDTFILDFKNKFLPQLNTQLQNISSLKVNKINNN